MIYWKARIRSMRNSGALTQREYEELVSEMRLLWKRPEGRTAPVFRPMGVKRPAGL